MIRVCRRVQWTVDHSWAIWLELCYRQIWGRIEVRIVQTRKGNRNAEQDLKTPKHLFICLQVYRIKIRIKIIKYCLLGNISPHFYFCSSISISISMSVGELKTWQIPMSHSYFSLRQLCLASSRRSGTVCKWRRAKITRGDYNFVYSKSSKHTSCSFCWCYLRKSVISDSWWQSWKSIIRFSNFFFIY